MDIRFQNPQKKILKGGAKDWNTPSEVINILQKIELTKQQFERAWRKSLKYPLKSLGQGALLPDPV